MKEGFKQVDGLIERYKKEIITNLGKMIAIKAIDPRSGGEGEGKRADFLESLLKKWSIKSRRYDYIDEYGAKRSNLVAKIGNSAKTVWVIAHIDTVAEGNRELWKTDPFKAVVKDGKIYGRGTVDNGQGVIGALYAIRCLKEAGISMKYSFGIALVAGEELGSRYGILKLLNEGIFSKNDLFLVPDSGNSKGDEIEIAEKSMLWLKITVEGKETHASMPQTGINAYRQSIRLLNEVDEFLHKKYNKTNKLFVHNPRSTFEMTKHEKNVDSINIIPGKETAYMDCRVLPDYRLDNVIADVNKLASKMHPGKAIVEVVNKEEAPKPTRPNAPIVKELSRALLDLRGIRPRLIGIGGGTCAAFIRRRGMQAAVWATLVNTEHQPNEYAVIDNIIQDTKVFAYLPI